MDADFGTPPVERGVLSRRPVALFGPDDVFLTLFILQELAPAPLAVFGNALEAGGIFRI